MVLQEEELVDAIFLKRAELDEQPDGPSQRLLNDQVLLSSDLCLMSGLVSLYRDGWGEEVR